MKKITIIISLFMLVFSAQMLGQSTKKEIKNPLGVEQFVKNYEKHGVTLSEEQKTQINELALVQLEKLKQEMGEMDEELSKKSSKEELSKEELEELEELSKKYRKALRKEIVENVMTGEQKSTLRAAKKAATN